MDYVSEAEAVHMNAIEARFVAAQAPNGILFVSVTASPGPGGVVSKISVVLGIKKWLSKSAAQTLAEILLRQETKDGYTISISIYQGTLGAAGVQGLQ